MSAITKSARGEECQIRIPGHCNFNPDTVVFCHFGGGGMAYKANDIHGAYGCSTCRDIIDKRKYTNIPNDTLLIWFYEAIIRTQAILIKKGLIKL